MEHHRQLAASGSIQVFVARWSSSKKHGISGVHWHGAQVPCCKSLANVVVGREVRERLLEPLAGFMGARQAYQAQGRPWAFKALLHGRPGGGKTSLVKALANSHALPLFILNIPEIPTDAVLLELVQDMPAAAGGRPHLLLADDVDRAPIFTLDPDEGTKGVSDAALLSLLDGAIEGDGRTVILTANRRNALNAVPALTRPGRIDADVEVRLVDAADAPALGAFLRIFYGLPALVKAGLVDAAALEAPLPQAVLDGLEPLPMAAGVPALRHSLPELSGAAMYALMGFHPRDPAAVVAALTAPDREQAAVMAEADAGVGGSTGGLSCGMLRTGGHRPAAIRLLKHTQRRRRQTAEQRRLAEAKTKLQKLRKRRRSAQLEAGKLEVELQFVEEEVQAAQEVAAAAAGPTAGNTKRRRRRDTSETGAANVAAATLPRTNTAQGRAARAAARAITRRSND